MKNNTITISQHKISQFCRKWMIAELSLFGSVLGDNFRPDSDIDVLIEFKPNIPWSSFDWIDMIDELKLIFGRQVDLVEKSGIRNPFRRSGILTGRRVIYDG